MNLPPPRILYPCAGVALLVLTLAATPPLQALVVTALKTSVAEPLSLLAIFFGKVIRDNLLVVGGAVWLAWDISRIRRLVPADRGEEVDGLAERVKMIVVLGMLALQYTKIVGLTTAFAGKPTAGILGAFGAAAAGFTAVFALTISGYARERRRLLSFAGGPAVVPTASAASVVTLSIPRWLPKAALGTGATIGLLLLLLWPGERLFSPAEPLPAKPAPPPLPKKPEPPKVAYTQENFDVVEVSDESATNSQETDTQPLPEGLRFDWANGGSGWEPAFILRDGTGTYWKNAHQLAPDSEVLRAFATEGPFVQPDRRRGVLVFHRDVLAQLRTALRNDSAKDPVNSVSVDSQRGLVLLSFPATAKREARTILVKQRE
jgi:hypothetical protein